MAGEGTEGGQLGSRARLAQARGSGTSSGWGRPRAALQAHRPSSPGLQHRVRRHDLHQSVPVCQRLHHAAARAAAGGAAAGAAAGLAGAGGRAVGRSRQDTDHCGFVSMDHVWVRQRQAARARCGGRRREAEGWWDVSARPGSKAAHEQAGGAAARRGAQPRQPASRLSSGSRRRSTVLPTSTWVGMIFTATAVPRHVPAEGRARAERRAAVGSRQRRDLEDGAATSGCLRRPPRARQRPHLGTLGQSLRRPRCPPAAARR